MRVFFFSSKGATVELAFKDPYFTAYRSASILDVDSLISKLYCYIILDL